MKLISDAVWSLCISESLALQCKFYYVCGKLLSPKLAKHYAIKYDTCAKEMTPYE